MRRTVVTGIVVPVALAGFLAFGQGGTASISGVVHDSSGAVLPGVTITAKHTDSGLSRTVVSTENGGYNFQLLPVGAYEITTELPGFKQDLRKGINLVVGEEAIINLTLEVGAAAEQVTVTDEAPIVNTTLNSTSGLINEAQIKDLPLNGRSFDQLLTLNVGTVDNRSNVANNGWTSFSVAGKRPETNRFLMNGVDYVGSPGSSVYITPSGASGQLLGVDAVREYNVVQHTYGAEYGKRAGAQVAVVTSSGTNQWHGDLFEYVRNNIFDSRNFFEKAKGPFKRNQFGGAIGGPIKKDKVFFFSNYEGFRERWDVPSYAVVPDAQARLGFLPNAAGVYTQVANLQRGMLPYANAYWPTPDPNGEIYQNGLPTGSAYATSNPHRRVREDFALTRLDYTHSSKDSFFVSFNIDDGTRTSPNVDPNFSEFIRQRSHVLGMTETHIFSPTVVNSATLGYSRARGTQVVLPVTPIPANLIFLTGTNPGAITIGGSAITVVPAAFATQTADSLNWNVRNHITWADDLHITKGNHSWSTGVWIQQVQQNIYGVPQGTSGSVSYATLQTFLQDQPTQFIANTNPQPEYYRTLEGAWYLQDEMKLKHHVTLRLGFREEMTNGWNEAHGHNSNYVFVGDVMQTDPRIGTSAFLVNNATHLLQPRVGLAWDPTGTGKWALRAGFGMHNDLQDNIGHRLNANAPYNARLTVMNTPLLSIIPIPWGKQLPPSCEAGSPVTPPNCSIFVPGGVDPVMKTPTLQQWSFTLERALTDNLMLQLSYVGSEGYHVINGEDRNTARPQVCNTAAGCLSGGAGTARATVPMGTVYEPAGPRPNAFLGPNLGWFFNGTTNYQAGNVSVTKRSSNGLTLKANYTYSKVLDISSAILAGSATNEPATLLDPFNPKLARGPASFNLKHQFNTNFLYPLPMHAQGLTDKFIGGWQWSGALAIQSGFPITPQIGANTSGTGDTLLPDVPNWNPNFTGPVILGKPGQYFNPKAFVQPTAGTFGNVSRGTLIGPGFWNLDTSLAKRFVVTEQVSMQFRAEAFNIFNHPNFASPNPVVFSGANYSANAGSITATANPSRQIQFALKLMF